MNTEEKTDTLVGRTRELLKNRPVTRTYKIVEEEIGIPVRWLQDFAVNPDREPSADRIQKLYEYLSGTSLFPSQDQN